MGSSQPCRAANQTHPFIICVSQIKSFTDDTRRQTAKTRQTHLWEKGRAPPDISPYEYGLKQKLRPLIRRDTVD